MTSLASVFALSFLHKEKMKRCCALGLCPCRGQMAPGIMPGYPGPGIGPYPGMRPGMAGFRPGMGGAFGGGNGGGGGGGGEEGEELQEGYEDTFIYHVRPGARPSMKRRRPPMMMRPHHMRPDLAAASAPSPDTNYPITAEETGIKLTSSEAGAGPGLGGGAGSSGGGSVQVVGGMLGESKRQEALVPVQSPVSRRLMSLDQQDSALARTHEEDTSCGSRSLGVAWNSPAANVPTRTRSAAIPSVTRNDGQRRSRRTVQGCLEQALAQRQAAPQSDDQSGEQSADLLASERLSATVKRTTSSGHVRVPRNRQQKQQRPSSMHTRSIM